MDFECILALIKFWPKVSENRKNANLESFGLPTTLRMIPVTDPIKFSMMAAPRFTNLDAWLKEFSLIRDELSRLGVTLSELSELEKWRLSWKDLVPVVTFFRNEVGFDIATSGRAVKNRYAGKNPTEFLISMKSRLGSLGISMARLDGILRGKKHFITEKAVSVIESCGLDFVETTFRRLAGAPWKPTFELVGSLHVLGFPEDTPVQSFFEIPRSGTNAFLYLTELWINYRWIHAGSLAAWLVKSNYTNFATVAVTKVESFLKNNRDLLQEKSLDEVKEFLRLALD